MKNAICIVFVLVSTLTPMLGQAQAAPTPMLKMMRLNRPMMCRGGRMGSHPVWHPILNLVFRDLHAIRRLSRWTRDPEALEAVYEHVLAISHNPFVRNYVSLKLARLELTRPKGRRSFVLLEKSLDANIMILNHILMNHRQAPVHN